MSVRASSAPTVIHENGANQNTDGASKENKSAPHHVGTTKGEIRQGDKAWSESSAERRPAQARSQHDDAPVQTAPIQKPYPSLNSSA